MLSYCFKGDRSTQLFSSPTCFDPCIFYNCTIFKFAMSVIHGLGVVDGMFKNDVLVHQKALSGQL